MIYEVPSKGGTFRVNLAQVTVITTSSTEADGSTGGTIYVFGREEGFEYRVTKAAFEMLIRAWKIATGDRT